MSQAATPARDTEKAGEGLISGAVGLPFSVPQIAAALTLTLPRRAALLGGAGPVSPHT